MRIAYLFPALLLAACSGKGTGDDTDTDTSGGDEFTPVEAVGDLSCHPGAASEAAATWNTQQVDAALQVMAPSSGIVQDFDSEDPVGGAKVEAWWGDAFSGSADATATSDSSGNVDLDVPQCQPFTYRTSTDPELQQTVDTFEAHQVYGPDASGTIPATWDSVSYETYNIIPSILGVSVDPAAGVIAGTAFDCGDAPIEHAWVKVVDASGAEPDGVVVKYFVDSFPNRDQPDTSADGLWVAINVPPGDWTVEMWTLRSGTQLLTGTTTLHVEANSINISNIYTGFGGGVKYPAECLVAG